MVFRWTSGDSAGPWPSSLALKNPRRSRKFPGVPWKPPNRTFKVPVTIPLTSVAVEAVYFDSPRVEGTDIGGVHAGGALAGLPELAEDDAYMYTQQRK